jgi:Family of unknown function (DUF6338)
MTEFFKTDIVGVAQALLSGFVAAWVFHGLTAHPKQTPFERIVQALILTAFVRAGVIPIKGAWQGNWTADAWNPDTEFLLSMLVALVVGVGFAFLANHDLPHSILRQIVVTKRTSFPSQWFRVFNQKRKIQYVVLTLKGDKLRRLYGWVREWPDQPDSGHFAVHDAEWVLENNERCHLYGVECVLIAATEVETCEFMLSTDQIKASKEELDRCEKLTVSLHSGGNDAKSESTGNGVANPQSNV